MMNDERWRHAFHFFSFKKSVMEKNGISFGKILSQKSKKKKKFIFIEINFQNVTTVKMTKHFLSLNFLLSS